MWNVDPRFLETVLRAHDRVVRVVSGAGPTLATHILPWIEGLAEGRPPITYFTHVRAFPSLLLPWLAEEGIAGRADAGLQEDLSASSMAAYYYVRLVDQVMDERDPPERRWLPAANVFFLAFLEPYRRRFPADHPMHTALASLWTMSAEITLHDGLLTDPTPDDFRDVSGRKQCAARIPVEAVLHIHGREALSPLWQEFFGRFGRWHQLDDDVFDWRSDFEAGRVTWFLAESKRRAPTADLLAPWIVKEGMEMGFAMLDGTWCEVLEAAREIGSPGLLDYLDERWNEYSLRRDTIRTGLRGLRMALRGVRK